MSPQSPDAFPPLFTYLGNGEGRIAADGELIIVNFAGLGGACVGLEKALNRPVTHAINHDPVAISLHRTNMPYTHHHIQDVWQVDPQALTSGRRIAAAWFSPDCFPAGTVVLTRQGYRNIEDIQVGDEVFTHRLRWRRVTEVSSTVRPLLRLRGQGHPGLTVSHEHPFYTRRRKDVWNNSQRRSERKLEAAEWTPAEKTLKGLYWAAPTEFPPLPIPAIPVYRGRQLTISDDLLWLAGRYLADGWTRLTEDRAELVITCGRHKADALAEKLKAWPRAGSRSGCEELAWHGRETKTAYQFTTSHKGLVEWLRAEFGHGAAHKVIPGWVFGLPEVRKAALLSGYLAGDGAAVSTNGNTVTMCTTVSKALAFGLKTLAGTLGHNPSVYLNETPNNVIEGRQVNAQPIWSVRWRMQVDESRRQDFREDGLLWTAVKTNEDLGYAGQVFNIGVEEDESYVAEGIVVHNCKHFSRAKGGKPREQGIRDLAWVTCNYTGLPDDIKPRVIFLENVPEFVEWGPLDGEGRPIPERKGETFGEFVDTIRSHGYCVEWRMLTGYHYGAPTTRKRLFLIARCDGEPIQWPEPTHDNPESPAVQRGERRPWRTAAECIDWDEPVGTIFERRKPLVPATMRRIARGLKKFVKEAQAPFIVTCNHGGAAFRGQALGEPLRTITAAHDATGLVDPLVMPFVTNKQFGNDSRPATAPLSTITTNHNKQELACAYLTRTGHYSNITGEGSHFRGQGLAQPLSTVTSGGNDKMLTTAHLTHFYGMKSPTEVRGQELTTPLRTQTTENRHGLTTACLIRHFGGFYTGAGQSLTEPLGTVTARDHHSLLTANLVQYFGTSDAADINRPMPGLTTKGRYGLSVANLIRPFKTSTAADISSPMPTVMTQGGGKVNLMVSDLVLGLEPAQSFRARQVYYLMTQYAPDALTERDHAHRLLLTVVDGVEYIVADVGMRMLTPRELARGQGFDDAYELERTAEGQPVTKTNQVKGIGNSVCPPVAEALARANLTMQEAAD
ncbi:DNA cytosine methyltransferase [Deinococcus sp. SL84]|uniref:DNA cytosine methyltransferase n=1 Tax=Deinococcus sp. SL84 TaxID=2994663 RepID=UPI00227560A4|nr:DNA cytosine methyltransferase [Deinococcus sp. SL84]MCY1703581.1 DNA cytosine methyltransferase [Deinococcus sp. SL84]